MQIPSLLQERQADFRRWRQTLHSHPEVAFEEKFTSDFVADRLTEAGIAVDRGWAGTGLVGTLSAGTGTRVIGLRADMDALPIQEMTGLDYQSTIPGRMHACGHDGHMAMLLAAAHYLAKTRSFDGTINFIFQPAEENEGGGRVMVEEGLFDRFPCEQVFGLHNWPGMPIGSFGVRPGPIMAAFDIFEIVIQGRGSHAAKPHLSIDPIVIAGQLISALQLIVSRQVNPMDQAVLSITQIRAGDTWNVIPDKAILRGTVRTFCPAVQDLMEDRLTRSANDLVASLGGTATVRYERRYPATVNEPTSTEQAARAAQDVVGASNVDRDPEPSMGAEDFAFMLQKRPGCYIWAGNGSEEGGRLLHNPRYDFNDDLIPIGAAYWVRLAENLLSVGSPRIL
ncbi:amidohydrolase [bacterium]|nr:amidohydrolase [bacterium]